MVPTPDADHRTGSRATPRVQIRPTEEELAAGGRLLRGDRALPGQTTEAVAVDAEVFGRAPCVHPVVCSLAPLRDELGDNILGHSSRQLGQELVEDGVRGRSERAGIRDRWTTSSTRSPAGDDISAVRKLALLGPPIQVPARPRGVRAQPGPLFPYERKVAEPSDGKSPFVRFCRYSK